MTDYSLRISETELRRYRMMASVAAAAEDGWWTEAGIVPGARVLDIGCGDGAVLVELARRIQPGGTIVGIDQGAESLEVARSLIAEAGLDNAELRHGDATATGLPEGEGDVVNIRHVLGHNTPATCAAIVAHARDLLKPGGHLYVVDADGSAFRFERDPDAALLDLNERYMAMLAGRGCETLAGPRLGAYAEDAGLEVVARRPRVDTIPLLPGLRPPAWAAREAMKASGHATDDDIARWDAAFQRSDASGQVIQLFGPIYTVIARRP
ncbi:MAG: methyltransferase domain-containing protein [Actinobacteria bacterium]|nr:methyltransferase domain-containing protein [Actinomycetota bacterium]